MLALALLATWGARAAARADEPPPPAPPPIADVETDPSGTLAAQMRLAEADRAAGAWARLVERLAELVRAGPEVLVPLPAGDLDQGELRWPAARAVELLAAELPPALRASLARQVHGARPDVEAQRARSGEPEALERLARAPVLEAAGEQALLLEAERALERGDAYAAVDFYRRWRALMATRPEAPRTAVGLRLATALARVGDEAGLRALVADAPRAPAGTGAAGLLAPVADEARRRLDTLRLGAPSPAPRAPTTLPSTLVPVWTRDLSDPDLRAPPGARERMGPFVSESVWAEPDLVLVHAGRRVSRLDPLTGVERWTFPSVPLGWDHDPFAKYEAHDLPLRCVERHGDLVFAVLGDPGGTGSFELGEQQLDVDTGSRESRARLVALDPASGALRWATGLLRETDALLGDRTTCCASPPLVVGEDVYVLLARRLGVAATYVACLERASGRPRWVRFLAAAESGRDPGVRATGGRADRPPVRAVPWGQRPALSAGELCVVPHAGLAAGLDVRTGELRWLRALPRFAPEIGLIDRAYGANARNEPVALPGVWAVAPMDAPVVLALEHGTGRLRWQSGLPAGGLLPRWRDLLGLHTDARGAPVLRLVGDVPALLDPFSGALLAAGEALLPEAGEPVTLAGRALDLGAALAVVEGPRVLVRAWPGEAAPSVRQIELRERAPGAGAPAVADLARAGPLWLTLEPGRLRAWVDREQAGMLFAAGSAPPLEAAGGRAAWEATAGWVLSDETRLLTALETPSADPAERGCVARALARHLAARLAGEGDLPAATFLQRLLPSLAELPAGERDRICALLALTLRRQGAYADLVGVLGRWIDAAPGLLALPAPWEGSALEALPLQDPQPGVAALGASARLRGDLVAAQLLRTLRDEPGAAAALAERETQVAERLARVRATDAPGPRAEALRTGAGTRALAAARERLALEAASAGEPALAAALAADLRLDPPEGPEGREPEARAWAARWQLAEAGWLVEAGDLVGARVLLEDLRRWVPSGTSDARGRTTSVLFDELRTRHGWSLERGRDLRPPLALWPATGRMPPHEQLAAVAIPTVEGPGAALLGERVLLFRGLAPEIWSLATGEQVARLDSGDQGWFGGTLQDGAAWLPERGVRVVSVLAGEPADRAGVQAGDWITRWDGNPVVSSADLMQRISASAPDQPVALELLRAGVALPLQLNAGRRPAAEAFGVLERARVWADAQGRLLLPTRVGVARVDLATARLDLLWRWKGPGTVLRLEVRGGLALVVVRRLHEDDLLVALDARDGQERWRTPLPGTPQDLDVTGSAVVATLALPGRVLLLDAQDGRLRAELPRLEAPTRLRAATLPPPATAEAACGRLYLIAKEDGPARFEVLNTLTGARRGILSDLGRADVFSGLQPSLSVGAHVALLAAPTLIRLYEPDPLREGFTRAARLASGDLLTEQVHHGGELDSESRIVMRGETLYVMRYQPRRAGSQERGCTVMVFGRLDDRADGRLRFSMLDHEPPLSRALGELVITQLEPHADGLLVTAYARQPDASGLTLRSTRWVPSAEGGLDERPSGPPAWEDAVLVARRAPPARVGRALLLPTDTGARVVPVSRFSAR